MTVAVEDGALVLEVADDGRGGAARATGSGLVGLTTASRRCAAGCGSRARPAWARPCAPSSRCAERVALRWSVEDFVENITRGNPGSVKAVLASIVLALAAYQLILAAIGYRKLPVIDAKPAFFTHRASGDAIAVLFVLVALMCLARLRLRGRLRAARRGRASARVVVLAIKVAVVRSGKGGRSCRTSA